MRVAIGAVVAILSGCAAQAAGPTAAVPSTTVPFEPVAPTFEAISPTPADLLATLPIAPERPDAGYDRGLFEQWIDADGDGCDTRCEVLEAERRPDLDGLPDGGWLSLYDGYTTDRPGELEVDHVVALAEAWRSGADTWDPDRRRAFANDLDHPETLIAVSAAANRAKRDRDAASWQPPNPGAWCDWARATVAVKATWSLTVDPAEVNALRNVLTGCP